jgi:hypothetical protein
VLGLAFYLYVAPYWDYSLDYFESAMILSTIFAGVVNGVGNGLILNWIMDAGADVPAAEPLPTAALERSAESSVKPASAAPLERAAKPPERTTLPRRSETKSEGGLWDSPIPLLKWSGMIWLGWMAFSLISVMVENWGFYQAFAGFALILAVGQWFFLRQFLPAIATPWGVLAGLGIFLGGYLSTAVFDSFWMPSFWAELFFGTLLAISAGLTGYLQSTLLPVDQKKRRLWIAASAFLGFAWFLFMTVNRTVDFSDYSRLFFSSLLVGILHSAATGLTLNWILSAGESKNADS